MKGSCGTRALKRGLERAAQDVECVVLIDPHDELRDEYVPGPRYVKSEWKPDEDGNTAMTCPSTLALAATSVSNNPGGILTYLQPRLAAEVATPVARGDLPPQFNSSADDELTAQSSLICAIPLVLQRTRRRFVHHHEISPSSGSRVGDAYQAKLAMETFFLGDGENMEAARPDALLFAPGRVTPAAFSEYLDQVVRGWQAKEDANVGKRHAALNAQHQSQYQPPMAHAGHASRGGARPYIEEGHETLDAKPRNWNMREQLAFCSGILNYGKNFRAIQKVLPHKSCGELVHHYYFCKIWTAFRSGVPSFYHARAITLHPKALRTQP